MTTLPSTTSVRLSRQGPGAAVLSAPGGGMISAGASPAVAAGTMTVSDVWRVIRGNLWLIIAALVLSLGAGFGVYKYLAYYYPLYQATGSIVLNQQTIYDPTRRDQARDWDYNLPVEQTTQMKMLMDPSLWMRVISDNQLLRDTPWFKNFQQQATSRPESKLSADVLAREDLEEHFRVIPEPGSKLLRVSMEASKREDARDIVRLMVTEHIKQQDEADRGKAQDELTLARSWSARYKREMNDAKYKMKALGEKLSDSGSPQAISRLSVQEMEISRLIDAQMKAQLEGAEAAGQLAAMQAQIAADKDPPQVEMLVRQDYSISRLRDMVDSTELALQMAKVDGEKSQYYLRQKRGYDLAVEKLKKAEESARALARSQLVDSLGSTVQSRKSEGESLSAQIKTRQDKLGESAALIADYQSAKEEYESYRVLDRELGERIEVLVNAVNQNNAGVSWYGYPTTPERMSSPELTKTMVIAGLIGLAASLGYAFLREISDTRVRSPRDIARVGQMNFLGMIADESNDPQLAGVPLHMVIGQAPHSIMAEQFRQVRTRLQHAASLDTTRTIVVTSPGPQDGKTTIATNLATGLALNGRRILLVDSNFRRPELHKLFSLTNDAGFANVLDAATSLETAVQRTSVANLEVLTTGPRPANPTELIESQLFSDFIDRALEEYDHVIFDAGPLLVVSEAVALAPRVDGVITVVRARKNTRGMLSRVSGIYRQIKAEHLGIVLNGVQNVKGGYYRRTIKDYYAYQNAE